MGGEGVEEGEGKEGEGERREREERWETVISSLVLPTHVEKH